LMCHVHATAREAFLWYTSPSSLAANLATRFRLVDKFVGPCDKGQLNYEQGIG
jgi:hypothetical protein